MPTPATRAHAVRQLQLHHWVEWWAALWAPCRAWACQVRAVWECAVDNWYHIMLPQPVAALSGSFKGLAPITCQLPSTASCDVLCTLRLTHCCPASLLAGVLLGSAVGSALGGAMGAAGHQGQALVGQSQQLVKLPAAAQEPTTATAPSPPMDS